MDGLRDGEARGGRVYRVWGPAKGSLRDAREDAGVLERMLVWLRDGPREGAWPEEIALHGLRLPKWLEQGDGRQERYAALLRAVRRARADALAEEQMRLFREYPLAWLLAGPGRDRPGYPGWIGPLVLVRADPIAEARALARELGAVVRGE
jgi:hypothetical protein